MKTKYKFVVLIVAACLINIAIYYISEKAQDTKYVKSTIEIQNDIDKELALDTSYSFDNPKVVVNPYGNSPLTAIIIFETKDLTTPTVTIKGKDEKVDVVKTFTPGKKHILPVYGLYANTNNKVLLNVNGKTKELNIKTEALPEDFNKVISSAYDSTYIEGTEFYFYTPASDGYTAAYDIYGDVRWYLNTPNRWNIKRLNNGNLILSSDRKNNEPYYNTGLVEMDLIGKIYYEYNVPNGYHHDVFEKEDGNFLVLSNNFDKGTYEDYAAEIDRKTGDIVKEINLNDIMDSNEGPKSKNSYDNFHINSIWYDDVTNSITLSSNYKNVIINIDYTTYDINWMIGNPKDFSKEYKKYFYTPVGDNFKWQNTQSRVLMTPEGNVLLFDNEDKESSKAIMYKLNRENKTIEEVFTYTNDEDFNSKDNGDVDYIGDSNYLILSGDASENNKSTTVELLNNKEIFKLQFDTSMYSAEKLSLYDGNDDLSLEPGKVLGSLGVTPKEKNKSLLLFNKKPDEAYNKYDLKIEKEKDRLKITGKFKTTDNVSFILDNVFYKRTYNMPISTRPYASMCEDDCDSDELTITKYINDEDINGKYYLYMIVNGKIYDFDLYVNY